MTNLKVTIVLIFVSGLFAISCNRKVVEQKSKSKYYYSCPMHQDIIEMKPGKCPKCGMTLEEWDINDMPKKNNTSSNDHANMGSMSHSGGCH